MSFSTLHDARTLGIPDQSRELLVLWQHPITRRFHPLGRLAALASGGFSYVYTRAAAEIEDLRPLRGLNDLTATYVLNELPAVFGQRVMDHDRADFAEYVDQLGLHPTDATPWEQIVRSGGARQGDTLQFMELPRVDKGVAHARFFVSGVRHIPNGSVRQTPHGPIATTEVEHEAALRDLRAGDSVGLLVELENREDQDAVLVTSRGVPLGWVPRYLSPSVRALLSRGDLATTVVRVNGPATSPHLRLVLDMTASVDGDFTFDPEREWEPLNS